MLISPPRVSVVMPVHNGAGYLRAAIDSVLTQTYQDFEFILIDDASQDETPALLAACQDARIRIITNPNNLGISRSLNRALDLAAGQYIARMDADDISLPDRFAKQIAFLDAHPSVGIVGGGVTLITETGDPLRTDAPRANTDGALRWLNLFGSPFVHPAVMLRRDVLRSVGGYDPNIIAAQDRDLWDRLLKVTQAANLPDCVLRLRVHTGSVSAARRQEQWHNAAVVTQRAMTAVLGRTVPLDLCEAIEHEGITTPADAVIAAHLIADLYTSFITQPRLQPNERQFIRDDYARRLYRLGRRWPRNPQIWRLLWRALTMNPALIGAWLTKQLASERRNSP